MTDFEKKLSLSLSDLKKVQRRVTALEETSQHSMSYLERAADNCWEYPNADDKYAELSRGKWDGSHIRFIHMRRGSKLSVRTMVPFYWLRVNLAH